MFQIFRQTDCTYPDENFSNRYKKMWKVLKYKYKYNGKMAKVLKYKYKYSKNVLKYRST